MSAFETTELTSFVVELDSITPDMPVVFDDTSLAFALGIRAKTLWWLLRTKKVGDGGLYEIYRIPKSSGGYRTIHAPRAALKNVQKSILVTFFGGLKTPEHIGAYVPGRGLTFTAKKHVGKAVKISMDLSDFFGSTRRGWVREWLRGFGYDKWCVSTLSNLMCVPVTRGGCTYHVLPQGAPTSGLVANWVANARIDTPILEYIKATGLPATYSRYSDNLEISFDENLNTDSVDQILKDLKGIIYKSKYRVNHKKTRVQRHNSPTTGMRVLGMTVNAHVNIPQQEYRRLRAIVHNCKTKGFATQLERAGYSSPGEMFSSIQGKLIYWQKINPGKIDPLLEDLREAAKTQDVQ